MAGFSVIFTTTDNIDVVRKIASSLLEENLSKCVQFYEVNSIYRWESKIEESKEYRMHIKAINNNVLKIKDLILSLHNYTLAELVVIEIKEGHSEYLKWLEEF